MFREGCVIRKLVHNADLDKRMKLTKKRLVDSLRALEEGKTVYQAKKIAGITVRYMYILWNEYKKTGEIPVKCLRAGKPVKPINPEHESIVKEAYEKYRICASRLTTVIERNYNAKIPVYTIHKIMLNLGLAKKKESKDVRKKKWVRYERKHSLTAVHMDWLYHPELELWALPVIDDSTRKLLSLVETKHATTDASIDAIEQAVMHGQIAQCITDHGPQFTNNEGGESRFQNALTGLRIKHILTRIKHPQSNGKSEKFGHLYLVHRTAFKTKEEFINWYNNVRPHMSLDEKTPEEVYQDRKHDKRVYYT